MGRGAGGGKLNNESSSGHTLNADLPLSKLAKLHWLALNRRNNAHALSDVDPALELSRLAGGAREDLWPRIDAGVSPARRLCDLFWMSLDWARIAAALGGSVRILEIGCGSGRYGSLLRDCLGEAFAHYRGVDVMRDPAWDALVKDSRFECLLQGSDDVASYAGDANLIFTQSALEHFEADMTFFRRLQAHVANAGRPVLQLHLIPSAGCLRTFMWHGVRQYTPRSVSRITRLFDAHCIRRLYALGGERCNRVHRRFITWPWLLGGRDGRNGRLTRYDMELHAAVRLDDADPPTAEACFYALALLHGLERDVLPA
jgi:hypothetical protein